MYSNHADIIYLCIFAVKRCLWRQRWFGGSMADSYSARGLLPIRPRSSGLSLWHRVCIWAS